MVERIMPRDYSLPPSDGPVSDDHGTSSAKPTGGSQTLKVGPAATRTDCGIRGQDFDVTLAHNSSACLDCPVQEGTDFPNHLVVPIRLSVPHICCRVAFHMQIHDWVGP